MFHKQSYLINNITTKFNHRTRVNKSCIILNTEVINYLFLIKECKALHFFITPLLKLWSFARILTIWGVPSWASGLQTYGQEFLFILSWPLSRIRMSVVNVWGREVNDPIEEKVRILSDVEALTERAQVKMKRAADSSRAITKGNKSLIRYIRKQLS